MVRLSYKPTGKGKQMTEQDFETLAEEEERMATLAGKIEPAMTLEDFEEIRAEEIRNLLP